MTDLAKCSGRDCPQREQCLRYTAPASEHQSWASFDADLKHIYMGCDGYWPIKVQSQ